MTFFALLAVVIGVLSALGLVLVGLIEMPWPFLLIGLLAVLYGLQRSMDASSGGFLSDPAVTTPSERPISKQASSSQVSVSFPPISQADIQAAATQAAVQSDELIYRGVRYRAGGGAKAGKLGS